MSKVVRQQHADWLATLDGDGPFLTVPALNERLPEGLTPTRPEQFGALRAAHTAWATAHPADADRAQHQWIETVVADVLGWGDHAAFTSVDRWAHTDPTHHMTVTPAFALLPVPADEVDADTTPVILGFAYPAGTPLRRRVGDRWPATPIDRAIHTMRAHNIPIGVVTDGRWWALVWAPRQTTPGYAMWTADLLLDDELLRSAFTTLLSRHRSLGVAETVSLHGLFAKSQDSQEDLTENLSKQVRRAVELLVDAFSTANAAAGGAYFTRPAPGTLVGPQPALERVPDDDIYQAAVTIVMRLVFTLAAEERNLLPADDAFYANAYGVGALAERLINRANLDGEDLLAEYRTAFPQLLATARVIHSGVRHPRLNLPGYGGSVFDPDMFPWLEHPASNPALGPIGVDDRTMLHILRGLTRWEGRRLSYRTLDVEQIGYAYEGLLDHTAVTAAPGQPVVALTGKKEPEVPLDVLEAQTARGDTHLRKWLKDTTGLTPAQITKYLEAAKPPVEAATAQVLQAACGANDNTYQRVLPWLPLLRRDERTGHPIVFNPGTTYVAASSARGDTGAHYTPKYLAEDVVKTTLDALLYSPGPLDTNDDTIWKPVHPEDIIKLRVADIAMGSGAFLVAAICYMTDLLIDSLQQADRDTLTTPALLDLWDNVHAVDLAKPEWDTNPDDAVILNARRLIAARTIYGVDINPMAVEMAKLSIWLITAARNQPFGFLDHRLLAGDSLLGIHNVAQLENLHLVPSRGHAAHGASTGVMMDYTTETRDALTRVTELRRQIEKQHVVDLRSIEEQERLYQEARALTSDLNLIADGVVAASLAVPSGAGRDRALDAKTGIIAQRAPELFNRNTAPAARVALRAQADAWLALDLPPGAFERHPLHWPLAYPEAFTGAQPGFDAIIGNPPFLGGQKLTGALGTNYREHLVNDLGGGARGSADLVSYMALHAARLVRPDQGEVGTIATNTLAQGDTREVGLDQIVASGFQIRSAIKSRKWPAKTANLEYCLVCTSRRGLRTGVAPYLDGAMLLDDDNPGTITPSLAPAGNTKGNPYPLVANAGIAFIGSYVLGMGFTMSEQEAADMIAADPRNAEVLFPYLNGQDLNQSPTQSAGRWVINFFDWDEDKAATYALPYAKVERDVKPERMKLLGRNPTANDRAKHWWRYGRRAETLYEALKSLESAIAITRVSSVVQPSLVTTRQVAAEAVVVFGSADPGLLGLIASSIHGEWVRKRASSMRTDVRYTPSDVFETYPFPPDHLRLRHTGQVVMTARDRVMASRQIGLTDTYNLVNNAKVMDPDVAALREAHAALDRAALSAYGWPYIDPQHGFYETAQGVRFTVHPEAREVILDRLLALNHARHAEEVKAGLVDESGKPVKRKAAKKAAVGRRPGRAVPVQQGLFGEDGE